MEGIISAETQVLAEYKSASRQWAGSGRFSIGELDYINKVYANLLSRSAACVGVVVMLLTADELRMSDAERLDGIDRVYRDIDGELRRLRMLNGQSGGAGRVAGTGSGGYREGTADLRDRAIVTKKLWNMGVNDLTGIGGLQAVLDNVYNSMIGNCSELIGVGRGLAGIAALWYIAVRVWGHMARAEAIDVYPLLRPFVIGIAITIFSFAVIGMINGGDAADCDRNIWRWLQIRMGRWADLLAGHARRPYSSRRTGRCLSARRGAGTKQKCGAAVGFRRICGLFLGASRTGSNSSWC